MIRTVIEYGPILGEKTTEGRTLQFYTATPPSDTCKVQWDTKAVRARATFQGNDDDGKTVVRPSLYSYGRIRLLPLELGKNAAGFGKLKGWDVGGVSEVRMALDVAFTGQKGG